MAKQALCQFFVSPICHNEGVRSIQVFIFRIVRDENEPDTLRGEVRSVASGEVRHFTNAQEMLALLHEMRESPNGGEFAADFIEIQITN